MCYIKFMSEDSIETGSKPERFTPNRRTMIDRLIDRAFPRRDQKMVRQLSETHTIMDIPISKRRFLKGAAALGGALALGGISTSIDASRKNSASSQVESAEASVEIPPLRSLNSPENFVFTKYLNSDLTDFIAKIDQESKRHLDNHDFFPPIAEKIRNYRPMIQQAAQTISERTKMSVDPAWIEIMTGLILTESSGNEYAVNKSENPKDLNTWDKGLCGIRKAAEDEAKAALNWGEVDVLSPDINITLGLCYLLLQNKKFNDPLLALSAYNQGPETIKESIKGSENSLSNNPGIDYTTGVLGSMNAIKEG